MFSCRSSPQARLHSSSALIDPNGITSSEAHVQEDAFDEGRGPRDVHSDCDASICCDNRTHTHWKYRDELQQTRCGEPMSQFNSQIHEHKELGVGRVGRLSLIEY